MRQLVVIANSVCPSVPTHRVAALFRDAYDPSAHGVTLAKFWEVAERCASACVCVFVLFCWSPSGLPLFVCLCVCNLLLDNTRYIGLVSIRLHYARAVFLSFPNSPALQKSRAPYAPPRQKGYLLWLRRLPGAASG